MSKEKKEHNEYDEEDNSLLSRILKATETPTADSLLNPVYDEPHVLPDGTVIYESTIIAANRILSINPHLNRREVFGKDDTYELYNGDKPVDLLNRNTFYSLIRADWLPLTNFQAVLLKQLVTENAPLFSTDCFLISDYLLWDKKRGKLKVLTEEEREKIRTVS